MQAVRAVAMLFATAVSPAAPGAGFAISDKSVSALGNAFAGAAALAGDASAVYNNPATLTQLEGSHLSLAIHRISVTTAFTDGGSSVGGPTETTASTTAHVPNAYYVTDYFGPGLRAGIGLYSPFGLGLAYDDEWQGRYHTIESKLRTINVSPTVAFSATPGLSFGASLDIQYAEARLEQAVDFGAICVGQMTVALGDQAAAIAACGASGMVPGATASDGRQVLKGDNWAYGISLGFAYQPGPRTRVGAVWHGPVRHEMSGQSDFDVPAGLPAPIAAAFSDSDGDVTIELPEAASVSLSHALSDRLTLLADYTWTGWERFDELRVKFANGLPDAVTPQDWNNAGRYSLGLNYRLNPAWLLRAGIAYDETPIPNAELRTPRVPDADRVWYTAGFNWAPQEALSLDFAYAYIPAGDVPSNNTDSLGHTLDGTYDVVGQFISAQLNWTF